MKRKLLVAAIASALVLPLIATTAMAQQTSQTSPTKAKKEKVQKLKKIVVTGSLIPQAQIETASPTITLTAGDIQRQGFSNIYQALRAQPLATGTVQDGQFTNGFTPAAKVVSLFGLPPGFTLTLINGKPMADYPLLYNGQSNVVDLSTIPMAMVDHIDIVPGNQSSIYGSSAIAGVINIVLKQRTQGYTLDYRAGGYSDGGGTNQRLQFVGGYNTNKLNLIYGIQFSTQKPIWGFQRNLTSSTAKNPNPNARYASRNYLVLSRGAPYFNYLGYQDPKQYLSSPCSAISDQYGGTVKYSHRPNSGYYCGSQQTNAYSTLMTRNRATSGYFNANYRLNSDAQLYGMLLYTVSNSTFSSGQQFWYSNIDQNGYFYNTNTNTFDLAQVVYAPEETGGLLSGANHVLSRTYSVTGGIRGNLGDSNWAYDAYFARSEDKVNTHRRWPLKTKVNAFFQNQFMGPQQGVDPYYSYYAAYAPDYAKMYQPITAAQYNGFTGIMRTGSETYTQSLNLQVTNTSLFELPAGPVGFAGVLQVGDSSWNLPTDPRVIAGDFWGITGSSGGGKRNNYAVATEFRVPILSQLTANVSARYDKYKNVGGSSDNDATYKIGLEYRPINTLLFRANYATAFRAPDLGYAFIAPSGFYSSATDYYRCATGYPNTPISQCPFNSVQYKGTQLGNPNLKSITAKSWGAGVVWSPTEKFNIKADFYDIRIKNQVSYQSVDLLMKQESACLLNQLPSSSGTCQAALAAVQRGPSGNLTGVTVRPVNISKQSVRGITSSANYRWSMGKYGDFSFGANYNVVLQHLYQQYPSDPVIDQIRNPYYSSEFKTILSGNLSWQIGNWTSTLYGIRYGKTPNYRAQLFAAGYATAGAAPVKPWILYNASVQYNITDNAKISLYVNNLFNAAPPVDKTWTAYPYYNRFNYNIYGRAYWVEFNVRFGTGK